MSRYLEPNQYDSDIDYYQDRLGVSIIDDEDDQTIDMFDDEELENE